MVNLIYSKDYLPEPGGGGGGGVGGGVGVGDGGAWQLGYCP